MKFRLVINMDNAAFEEDPIAEVCDILDSAKHYLRVEGKRRTRLHDVNGNDVGEFVITEK